MTLGGLALALNVSQSAGLWDRVVVVAFLLAAPTAALLRLLPGLGLALALLVGGAGAVAVILYHNDAQGAQSFCAEVVTQAAAAFGKVNHLVNNAFSFTAKR